MEIVIKEGRLHRQKCRCPRNRGLAAWQYRRPVWGPTREEQCAFAILMGRTWLKFTSPASLALTLETAWLSAYLCPLPLPRPALHPAPADHHTECLLWPWINQKSVSYQSHHWEDPGVRPALGVFLPFRRNYFPIKPLSGNKTAAASVHSELGSKDHSVFVLSLPNRYSW